MGDRLGNHRQLYPDHHGAGGITVNAGAGAATISAPLALGAAPDLDEQLVQRVDRFPAAACPTAATADAGRLGQYEPSPAAISGSGGLTVAVRACCC